MGSPGKTHRTPAGSQALSGVGRRGPGTTPARGCDLGGARLPLPSRFQPPMDNIAHALVGAALGRAVADRTVRAAALMGAIAGNAPDWVAIVDPFFWVVPLVALAWGARRHWAPALAFLVALLGFVSLVLWRRDVVAGWVRVTVIAAALAAVVGWTRHWFGVAGRRRAAAAGVLVLTAYAAANAAASVAVKHNARGAAIARFGPAPEWAALTLVGRPFRWELLAASADSVAGPGWTLPRHLDQTAVRAALATPQGHAIAQFARFLAAQVDSSGTSVRVSLWDVRYHRPGAGAAGWAAVQVRVP